MVAVKPHRTEALPAGMGFLLILTVVQRAKNFGRGICFDRWLDETSLGQRAMAMGFVSLATPQFLQSITFTLLGIGWFAAEGGLPVGDLR